MRLRQGASTANLGFHADQAILQACFDVLDHTVGINDAVLDFHVPERGVATDAREGADVGVLDDDVLPEDDGADDLAASHAGRLGDDDPAREARSLNLPLDVMFDPFEEQPVGVEQIRGAARVLPPALDTPTHDLSAALDQALDAVRDLVFAACRGWHTVENLEDLRREAVQASDREIARRNLGLFDKALDLIPFKFGDPEGSRVRHLNQRDERRRAALLKLFDERPSTVLEEVVAEVHAEVVLTDPFARGQDGMPQAELLVLVDQGDRGPLNLLHRMLDLLAGDVGDNDPDVRDARAHQRVNGVVDDRLASDAQHRFGTGERQWTEASAQTGSRNDGFHHCLIITER